MEQVACFFHHPRVKSVYSPPEETGGNLFAARLFTEEAGPQTPLLCLVNPPYFSHFVVLTMGFTLQNTEYFQFADDMLTKYPF
jgi:hypothetical protein